MSDEKNGMTTGQLAASDTGALIKIITDYKPGDELLSALGALDRIGKIGDVAKARAHLKCPDAVAALLISPDSHSLLKLRAIATLVELNDSSRLYSLKTVLSADASFVVRAEAAEALGAINLDEAERIEVGACLSTALVGYEYKQTTLPNVSKDSSSDVRAAVAKAIGNGGYTLRAPALVQALDDEPIVRSEAVKALGKLGVPVGNEKLKSMLVDEDDGEPVVSIRAAIVATLAVTGGREELADIMRVAENDPCDKVRATASKVAAIMSARLDEEKYHVSNGFAPGLGGGNGGGEFEQHLWEPGAPHHRFSARRMFAGNLPENRGHAKYIGTVVDKARRLAMICL